MKEYRSTHGGSAYRRAGPWKRFRRDVARSFEGLNRGVAYALMAVTFTAAAIVGEGIYAYSNRDVEKEPIRPAIERREVIVDEELRNIAQRTDVPEPVTSLALLAGVPLVLRKRRR